MLGIFLWVLTLIIWIGNLILRTRPSMKNVKGNGLHIFIAVLFIMLSVVNIVRRAISLNSDASPETISTETTATPIEEQTYNGEKLFIIEDSY